MTKDETLETVRKGLTDYGYKIVEERDGVSFASTGTPYHISAGEDNSLVVSIMFRHGILSTLTLTEEIVNAIASIRLRRLEGSD